MLLSGDLVANYIRTVCFQISAIMHANKATVTLYTASYPKYNKNISTELQNTMQHK